MKYLIIFIILTISCADNFNSNHESGSSHEGEVWICHNPQSEYHGHICSDECYWVGQLLVKNSYCWILEEEDCTPPLTYEWQDQNCHFFN